MSYQEARDEWASADVGPFGGFTRGPATDVCPHCQTGVERDALEEARSHGGEPPF
ncbi:MAG: hypothetical protein JO168_10250 [Solirubrobacterales bacterium]|nr:hypothetical protein [Solirubrobacterales bacterium]MBV9717534.1 hypothetical protein [Solirubrobacterales bacterium]